MRFEDLLELTRRLYAGAPYPAALADDALRVCWANPAAARLLEMNTDKDGNIPGKELVSPTQRGALLAALRGGAPCTLPSADGGNMLVLLPVQNGARLAGCQLFSGQGGRMLGAPDARALRRFAGACEKSSRLPLTIIFSTLSLLEREKSPHQMRKKYLSLIRQNCYRLLRSSNNLSASLALCAGQEHPELQNGDLAVFLTRLHADVEPLLARIDIPIVLEAPEPVRTAFDPHWMRRILLNLISNSCRFTREGNRITLRLTQRAEWADITVADRGAGISETLLAQIAAEAAGCSPLFDSRAAESVGLGLALSRRMATLQSGTLHLRSVPGESTEATLSLPLRRDVRSPEYLAQKGAAYAQNRFADVYVELSDVCNAPDL